MRTIIVNGERWKWCVIKTIEGGYSEYTPGFPALYLFLRSFGGELQQIRAEDVLEDVDAITPRQIVEYIKKLQAAA